MRQSTQFSEEKSALTPQRRYLRPVAELTIDVFGVTTAHNWHLGSLQGPHVSRPSVYLSCAYGFQYVGCTSNMRLRLNNHKSCVRTKKVARTTCCFLFHKHFRDSPNHSFDYTILEYDNGNGVLTQIECRWISKLRTSYPWG